MQSTPSHQYFVLLASKTRERSSLYFKLLFFYRYECECKSGYDTASDGLTCENINECLTSNGGCEQLCVDIPGSSVCECLSGYSLNQNGKTYDCILGTNL